MQDRLIKLCGLYRNVSQKTGKEYFSGNLTLFSKILILANPDRKTETEPTHFLFIAEREQKPEANGDRRPNTKGKPEAGDYGGIASGDWPTRSRRPAA